MRTVAFEKYGGVDVLHLADIDIPKPKEDEVLIKVQAASMNDWDAGMSFGLPLFMRFFTGLFKPKPKYQYPGCDVAGIVESAGAKVSRFKIGDAVYGDLCASGFSSFAEYVCAPENTLALKPKSLTFEQAACLPQAGQLAIQGLIDTGNLKAGQKLLINGAGGGVGTVGVQMAKDIGCEVTVVDKASKLEMLLALGANHGVDYEEQDFCKMNEQYDLILDTKSTRSPFSLSKALRKNGLYATVGGSMVRVLQLLVLNPVLSRFSDKQYRMVAQKPNKDLPLLSTLAESGKLLPVIDDVYNLDNYRAAYERYLSANQKGNVIIRMNSETS